MRFGTLAVLGLVVAVCGSAAAQETVVPLKVEIGGESGLDTRVFSAPVNVNGTDTHLLWGCGGWTIVTERFATKAGIRPQPDAQAARRLAGNDPVFLGSADTDVRLGDMRHRINIKVIKDKYAPMLLGDNIDGIVGYELARKFQWQLNPDWDKPTLVLRQPRAKLPVSPVATLDVRDQHENVWLNIKVRGVAVDVVLMPQSTDMQAGPTLQRKWDIASGKEQPDIKTLAGAVRSVQLVGKDAVEFSPTIKETDVRVILVGNANDPEDAGLAVSGLGGSLLNRFSYCVDAQAGKMYLIARTPEKKQQILLPPTRRASQPAR